PPNRRSPERTETLQERDVYLQQAESYRIQESEAADDRRPDDATRLGGEYLAAKVKAEGADRKVEILKQRIENLTVRSPIDGVVATFQVQKNLLNRPVRRGELPRQVLNVDSEDRQSIG